MADMLLRLAANSNARKIVKTLGLPLPMPQRLERAHGPWVERPLHDRDVLVGGAPGAELTEVLAQSLTRAGANPWLTGDPDAFAEWRAAGETWGRPPREATGATEPGSPWALVFDATGVRDTDGLRALYEFFHARIRTVGRSGRLVVLGRRPADAATTAAAAAQRALDGFVRSAGREIGRRGATANLIVVQDGAEDRLDAALRFLLSPRSAYISGQPIPVTKRCRKAPAADVRPLDGKVALVTGAARGIGAAIATAMAREGARVVVLDRPEDAALGSEVARELGGLFLPCDVTDPQAAEKIGAFLDDNGLAAVDVLVNNAGVTRDKTLARMDPARWDLTLQVNLAAVIGLTEALLPRLGKQARVVCLSSIAGIAGNVGQTNYAASKAGVIGFVEALAPKLARRGIAVNAIAPGFIETRLTDAIPIATREIARRLANLGQGGLPQDIAQVATFLASPGASGLCGHTLRVCGGSFVGA